jgi:hypothetical protein
MGFAGFDRALLVAGSPAAAARGFRGRGCGSSPG